MTSNSDPSGKGRPREGRGEEHHGRKEQLVTVPKAQTQPITAMERLRRLQPRGPRMAGDVGVQRRGSRRHVRGIWGNLDSEVNHCTPDPVLSKWENQGSSLNPKPQFSRCVMPPSNGGGCGPAGSGWALRGSGAAAGSSGRGPSLPRSKEIGAICRRDLCMQQVANSAL